MAIVKIGFFPRIHAVSIASERGRPELGLWILLRRESPRIPSTEPTKGTWQGCATAKCKQEADAKEDCRETSCSMFPSGLKYLKLQSPVIKFKQVVLMLQQICCKGENYEVLWSLEHYSYE